MRHPGRPDGVQTWVGSLATMSATTEPLARSLFMRSWISALAFTLGQRDSTQCVYSYTAYIIIKYKLSNTLEALSQRFPKNSIWPAVAWYKKKKIKYWENNHLSHLLILIVQRLHNRKGEKIWWSKVIFFNRVWCEQIYLEPSFSKPSLETIVWYVERPH